MRFAYIDSHGNEVPIPSVDALALRIELGAIGPDTELYDAQADHWGPAKTHEIFHTLARDTEEDGLMAPPPPVAPSPPSPSPPEAQARPAPEPPPPAPGPEPVGTSSPVDLGLTLAESPPEPPASKPKTTAEPKQDEQGSGAGFDFGDLSAGLQLDASPLDLASPLTPDPGAGTPAPADAALGGGLMPGGDDDLLLEAPLSAFQADAAPGWTEPVAEPVEGLLDFSAAPAGGATPDQRAESAAAPAAAPASAAAPERRASKSRSTPPRPRRRRSLSGPIVLVVLLAALGVGGYVSWPIVWPAISEALAARRAPERPAVVMPVIPAELLPRVRTLAEAAIADVVAEVDASTGAGVPTQPHQDWLAGAYLADASRFEGVETFWLGMRGFLEGMLAADWQLYHDQIAERVQQEGLAAETAAMIVERADSGFVAAAAGRAETYALMDALVTASLDLHEFLLLNEGNIEYRPATTSTADPVLEAVPSSPAIGDQMWEMVDGITDALDALGTLDRVTRDRLLTAFRGRLQQVGIE